MSVVDSTVDLTQEEQGYLSCFDGVDVANDIFNSHLSTMPKIVKDSFSKLRGRIRQNFGFRNFHPVVKKEDIKFFEVTLAESFSAADGYQQKMGVVDGAIDRVDRIYNAFVRALPKKQWTADKTLIADRIADPYERQTTELGQARNILCLVRRTLMAKLGNEEERIDPYYRFSLSSLDNLEREMPEIILKSVGIDERDKHTLLAMMNHIRSEAFRSKDDGTLSERRLLVLGEEKEALDRFCSRYGHAVQG